MIFNIIINRADEGCETRIRFQNQSFFSEGTGSENQSPTPGFIYAKKGHSCNAGVHQSIEATEIYEMWLTTITGGVEKSYELTQKKSSLSVV